MRLLVGDGGDQHQTEGVVVVAATAAAAVKREQGEGSEERARRSLSRRPIQ